jgi:hypothetical protein
LIRLNSQTVATATVINITILAKFPCMLALLS